MTQEQANKILNAFTDIAACDGNSKSISAIMHELREAVGKQVPRELEKGNDGDYMCPRCGDRMYGTEETKDFLLSMMPYCSACGQRLKG